MVMAPPPAGPRVPVLSRRNEVEVHALLAGSLEESISEAKRRADAANDHDDSLVHSHLVGRAHTLQKGLARIHKEYPEVIG